MIFESQHAMINIYRFYPKIKKDIKMSFSPREKKMYIINQTIKARFSAFYE